MSRRPGEDFYTYRDRVAASELWSQSRDTAYHDGSPEGARELNGWVQAQPGVYYFSWATEATTRDPISGTQVPEIGVPDRLSFVARFIGSYTREGETDLPIDETWWQNDGIVNTCSMDGPTLGSSDRIEGYSGAPVPGQWNYMGLLESTDHLDIIGIPTARPGLRDWYLALAALLASVPQ